MAATLQIVTIGPVDSSLLRDVAGPILQTFKLASVSGPALAHPKYALNPSRGQFHAAAIIRRLQTQVGPNQLGVLGVSEVDLFDPDADFIHGEADREAKSAVISMVRLRPIGATPEQLVKRAQSEACRFVGQLLGLADCDDAHCVMFNARTAQEVDRKGIGLCHDCRTELVRLSAHVL